MGELGGFYKDTVRFFIVVRGYFIIMIIENFLLAANMSGKEKKTRQFVHFPLPVCKIFCYNARNVLRFS